MIGQSSNLPNKQDTDASVVLCAFETEIIFEVVQSRLGDRITVEVVLNC